MESAKPVFLIFLVITLIAIVVFLVISKKDKTTESYSDNQNILSATTRTIVSNARLPYQSDKGKTDFLSGPIVNNTVLVNRDSSKTPEWKTIPELATELNLVNLSSYKGPIGPVGIRGPKGPVGDRGPKGESGSPFNDIKRYQVISGNADGSFSINDNPSVNTFSTNNLIMKTNSGSSTSILNGNGEFKEIKTVIANALGGNSLSFNRDEGIIEVK